MADNFGEGILQGLQGAQSLQMGSLAMQGQELKNESESLAIQQAKLMMANQQAVAKRLAAMNQGGGQAGETVEQQSNRVAKQMFDLSSVYAESNMPEQAEKFATAGATAAKTGIELQSKIAEQEYKKAEHIGALAETVTDDKSWKAALQQYQLSYPNEPLNPALLQEPYSPQLIERLKAGAQTIKDRAQTKLAEQRQKQVIASTKEQDAMAGFAVARTDLARAQAEKLKNAGVTVKAPTAQQLQSITDLAMVDHDGETLPAIRARARSVAEDAAKIFQDNPDKGWDFAAKTAYTASVKRGDWVGMRTSRVPTGSSPKKPLEPDYKSNGQIDESTLQEGQWYQTNKGPRAWLNGQMYSEEELKDEDSEEDPDDRPAE